MPLAPIPAAPSSLVPYALRCESLSEPLGIGRREPALSWKLRAARKGDRNLSQRAYRILAATEPGLLEEGRADLWDSGYVASDGTYGIPYAGKPLASNARVFWRVGVWANASSAPSWNPAASFSLGLLAPGDWKAKWIAVDAPEGAAADAFKGASWIWSAADPAGDVPGGDVPAGERTFVRRFSLKGPAESALLDVSADDQFTLFVNGREAAMSDGRGDAWRRPVRAEIAPFLKAGENELRLVARNEAKGPAGAIARLALKPKSGEPAVLVTDAEWRDESGVPARVLGPFGAAPWRDMGVLRLRPATYYRKEFAVRPGLLRATAHVSALGLVDLHVNGARASENLFDPGWTDYDRRVAARTFDVTHRLKPGANVVGAVLGDGWYSGYVGYDAHRALYGDRPRVRVQLDLEYADGRRETVASGEDWRGGTGAIVEGDFLAGETYDARLEPVGWDRPGPAPEGWKAPYAVAVEGVAVEPHPGPPVLPYDRLRARSVREIRPGVWVLDFGQNLAGFARLRVRGRRGSRVTLRFAEALNPDGTIYTANLRGARATDHYVLKGGGKVEEWSPRFTFHGFRYVEVSGLGHAPGPSEIVAVAISSATPEVGSFACSDPMLNKLAHNAWWTQKMNFIDVPTDCPQRDERLGWTGDAQAYLRTAAMYSDVGPFFAKWLVSLEDGQRADGQFPMVAPLRVAGDDGGPAWADAGVICPWTIYDVYGDRRELAERYDSMRRFVEFCRARSGPDLLPPARFHAFGDWLSIGADTPNEVIYEAYFVGSARLLARSAEALGKAEDAARYRRLADDVAAAFRRAYVSPEGVVKGDTQCAYVLALGFDLLDEGQARIAADRLVADIERRGGHLSTGFVGTRDILGVLSKIGRDDVAFRLLHNTTFPSWGFEIANGATTVWERWDGWTPEKGFQDPGMNSFAHYAYGAVMGWVFARIGGIENVSPGFGRLRVAPAIDPRLTWAKTGYDSVRGPVRTEWRVEGGKLALSVEVPPNATAEIRMPTRGGAVKTDAGAAVRTEPGASVYAVGSGRYRFVTLWR